MLISDLCTPSPGEPAASPRDAGGSQGLSQLPDGRPLEEFTEENAMIVNTPHSGSQHHQEYSSPSEWTRVSEEHVVHAHTLSISLDMSSAHPGFGNLPTAFPVIRPAYDGERCEESQVANISGNAVSGRVTAKKRNLRKRAATARTSTTNPTLADSRMPPREFACPFYKRNRSRYWLRRSCRTSGWPTVHRVKEHVYRHHMHFVCDRCSAIFQSQEQLRGHLRQPVPCPVGPRNVAEDLGFGHEVEKMLRSRKKIEGNSESVKWRHMFRLLFPSFQNKPTPLPYIDDDPRNQQLEPVEWEPQPEEGSSSNHALTSSESNLNAMVMVAAAAEQHIQEAENASTGLALPLPPNEDSADKDASRPELSTAAAAAEGSSPSLEDSIRKMVEEQIFAVLHNNPSAAAAAAAAALPSPADSPEASSPES